MTEEKYSEKQKIKEEYKKKLSSVNFHTENYDEIEILFEFVEKNQEILKTMLEKVDPIIDLKINIEDCSLLSSSLNFYLEYLKDTQDTLINNQDVENFEFITIKNRLIRGANLKELLDTKYAEKF